MGHLESDPMKRGILIVDDEPAIRTILGDALKDKGYEQIFSASDGVEAISILSTYPDDVYMILLDLRMPGMDGISLVRHLVNVHVVPVGIVMVTGYASLDSAVEFFNSANETVMALDYISKPFRFNELLAEVERVLDRVHKKRAGFLSMSADGLHERFETIEERLLSLEALPRIEASLAEVAKKSRGFLAELGMDVVRTLAIAASLLALLYLGIGDFLVRILSLSK